MSQLFRKYKLVPIDNNELTSTENNLREYNPTLRVMAKSYLGSKQALSSRLPTKVRLQLMTANRSRFNHLTQQKSNQQEQTPKMEPQPPPQPAATPNPPQLLEPKPEMKISYRPNVAISKRHAGKYENLLKLTSDTIGVGNQGEVVIRGREVKNSSFSDVMRSLYSGGATGKAVVPGLTETIAELKRLQVPSTLITSPHARAIYQSANQKGSGKCARKPGMLRLY